MLLPPPCHRQAAACQATTTAAMLLLLPSCCHHSHHRAKPLPQRSIGDSQLCFLHFDSMMSTMCLLDGSTHYHWEAHQILQYNIYKGWLFICELKYEVVMLPR
jgi:hypothetical protein